MPNIVQLHTTSLLSRHTEVLTQGATSGRFIVTIPFPSDYVAIVNQSAANVLFVEGELYTQSPEVTPVEPGGYISTRMRETQKVTVFWNSATGLAANSTVMLQFSNEPIPMQAGNITPNSTTSNVAVTNAPNVNVASMPNVAVSSLPAGAIESVSSGVVYNAQVALGAAAVQITIPNNLGIKRVLLKLPATSTGPVFLGKDGTVTTATGGAIDPGDPSLEFPVVANSTLAIWGIAAAAQTITVLGLA